MTAAPYGSAACTARRSSSSNRSTQTASSPRTEAAASMDSGPQLLLIGAVAAVGVLHTVVPDHWVPITMLARQRGWSKSETARASLQAGTGHVLSTLLIALVVWMAGVAFAER